MESKFFYWNLSYKRKIYRTIGSLPIIMLVPIVLYWGEINKYANILISSMNFFIWIAQLVYNYKKYKCEENK
ncbi:hypothetical protein KQI89_17360 [Clostridium sp. MSJ-4]|uniref:Uncharacterized protein n=1 Tax=Clostridium simiarum TaxID=2841506 RepID=A0ABS6F4Q2_9CLOT|nr:hypothetical protein [Clostridium simiarum]MBU5593507.1 hypothetical protein [Clostridium simiarum]